MTPQALYDLTTELLDGNAMNETTWNQLVNMARMTREGARDWQILKKKSTALSWLTTDNINVTKSLAAVTGFLRPIKQTAKSHPIIFLDANGNKAGFADEVLMEQQYDKNNVSGFFTVDYGAKTLAFTAPAPQTLTAVLFYIQSSGNLDIADDTTAWKFPAEYHPLLAYDVANMQKGGIDYDDINARMVQFARIDAQGLENAMIMWDERIKLSALGV